MDAILIDDSITDEAAAWQLRTIASDRSVPMPHRLEALQHGLNLGITAFSGFAESQPDLPPELAAHLLFEMINYNESPADQIRTYLALMNHPDVEVSTEAREMLAFQVGDDMQEESLDRLARLAREKIQSLATDNTDE